MKKRILGTYSQINTKHKSWERWSFFKTSSSSFIIIAHSFIKSSPSINWVWNIKLIQEFSLKGGYSSSSSYPSLQFDIYFSVVSFGFLFQSTLFSSWPRVGAVLGNMAFFSTIVTSLIPGRPSTVSRDMAHLTTIETTAVLSTGLVDHLPIITFQSRILTFSCDMARLEMPFGNKCKQRIQYWKEISPRRRSNQTRISSGRGSDTKRTSRTVWDNIVDATTYSHQSKK